MKSLFLIIFLLIPSISIARPLLGCDDDRSFLHTIMIIEAIKESKQPPPQVQLEPIKRPNKELTDQQIEKLSERLTNQLWENNNDD